MYQSKEPVAPQDILIGKNKWLSISDVSGLTESARNIDHIIVPTEKLWSELETICVSACCGIHAFDFQPPSLKSAAANLGHLETKKLILELKAALNETAGDCFVSEHLNSYMTKIDWDVLLDHMLKNLKQNS